MHKKFKKIIKIRYYMVFSKGDRKKYMVYINSMN